MFQLGDTVMYLGSPEKKAKRGALAKVIKTEYMSTVSRLLLIGVKWIESPLVDEQNDGGYRVEQFVLWSENSFVTSAHLAIQCMI